MNPCIFSQRKNCVHLIFSFLADDDGGWWPFCVAVVVVGGGGRQLPPLPSQLYPLGTRPCAPRHNTQGTACTPSLLPTGRPTTQPPPAGRRSTAPWTIASILATHWSGQPTNGKPKTTKQLALLLLASGRCWPRWLLPPSTVALLPKPCALKLFASISLS